MVELTNDWLQNSKTWQSRIPTIDAQAEFFLLKFGRDDDLTRDAVMNLKIEFEKFDLDQSGELEENEALRLLESRDETKTFKEMRAMVADIDLDQNRCLSFLEWACAIFDKSWKILHSPVVDPEEIKAAEELQRKALEEYAIAQEEQKEKAAKAAKSKLDAEEKIKLASMSKSEREEWERKKAEYEAQVQKEKEEEEEKKRQDEAEKQKQLGQKGVKGKAAMFFYAAKDTASSTESNMERILREASERKEKKRLKKIADEKAKKDEEDQRLAKIAAEKAAEEKKQADEAAERQRIAEEEKAIADQKKAEAEKGSIKAKIEQEAYEKEKAAAEKKQAEEEAAKKKDREERRARLKAKAALWENK